MKSFNPHSRARRSSASQRAQLLTAFDRSGLSAAAFARKHQLNYTTFCGWRQRRNQTADTVPGFVQVELPVPNFSGVVKMAEVASHGFWDFGRARVVFCSRITTL
jgi:hypothetical protein